MLTGSACRKLARMWLPSRPSRDAAICRRTYSVISGVNTSPCLAPARATRTLSASCRCTAVIFAGVAVGLGALPATRLRKSRYCLARDCKSAASFAEVSEDGFWAARLRPESHAAKVLNNTRTNDAFRREVLTRILHRLYGF